MQPFLHLWFLSFLVRFSYCVDQSRSLCWARLGFQICLTSLQFQISAEQVQQLDKQGQVKASLLSGIFMWKWHLLLGKMGYGSERLFSVQLNRNHFCREWGASNISMGNLCSDFYTHIKSWVQWHAFVIAAQGGGDRRIPECSNKTVYSNRWAPGSMKDFVPKIVRRVTKQVTISL